jgi:type III pantothenate kinase
VNLIVEQGNTKLKAAIFENGQIVSSVFGNSRDYSIISQLLEKRCVTQVIISSVITVEKSFINEMKSKVSTVIFLNENTPVPITMGYETPATLGKDRLAAVVGANYLKPDKNNLVIDAGTAITYEFIDYKGVYAGGNISPGMTTRFRALHHFTGKLPLVNETENVSFIGNSTEKAIIAGVVNGIVFEMDGYIDTLKARHENFFVFLTGGHSFYFESRLKNHIFADPNLVLTGLNRILEYNAEIKSSDSNIGLSGS